MNTQKFYKVAITVLVLVNLVIIVAVFVMPNVGHLPPHRGGLPNIAENLGIEGEARQKIDMLEKQHHHDKRLLLDKNKKFRENLFSLMKLPKVDSSQKKNYIDSIAATQREIDGMTFDYFLTLKSFCNAEQQKKLDEAISGAIMMTGGGHPKK